MSIAEKLQTIAENEQKVYNSGKLAVLKDSKYMNANVNGTVIAVNDVSPIEHELGVSVRSKNLYDSSRIMRVDESGNTLARIISSYYIPVEHNTNYILSATNVTSQPMYAVRGITKEEYLENPTYLQLFNNGVQIAGNTNQFNSGNYDYIVFRSWQTNEFYGITDDTLFQLEIGTTATAYTPYVTDLSKVIVSRYGKNLVDLSKSPDVKSANYNFDSATGYYEVINAKAHTPNRWRFKVPANSTIYLCADEIKDCNVQVSSVLQEGTDTINIGLQKGSFVYCNTGNYTELTLSIYASSSYDSISAKGVRVGLDNTSYEPYKESQTATANAYGTVNGLTSLSHNMTLVTDTEGVNINCKYYRDIDRYIDNLNVAVALTGGE